MPRNPDCANCSLRDVHVYTRCLWGDYRERGPIPLSGKQADVLILGEAPGYNEDLNGMVFIGASGELLRGALNRINLNQGYYITNVAKCFPGTKLPRDAAKGCADYLEEELAEVKPKYILALGNTAIQRLTGKGKITELAGKEIWSERYNCWIVPALHPAAILRNMGKHAGWVADLQHFADLVHGTLSQHTPVQVAEINTVEKLDKLAALLRQAGKFAFDFEATPIEWWDKDWAPWSISFSVDGAHSFVIPLEHPLYEHPDGYDVAQWMNVVWEWVQRNRDLFQDPQVLKVAHQRLYDTLAWWRTFGYQIATTNCSMIACHLLDENEPKSLKWQGRTKLGWPDWDIDAAKLHPWPETMQYNGTDSAATFKLMWEVYEPLLKEHEQWDYYQKLLMQDAAWIERMIWRGMPVDEDARLVQLERAKQAAAEAKAAIPVVNPGSTKQVGAWLYDELKLPILKLTPAGKPSTDEDTINRLALLGHEAPKQVLSYRGPEKNRTTYIEPIGDMTARSFDSRLHPDIRMAGPETGRHASFMHTVPRDSDIRSIINSTDPNWVLLEVDQAQVEARLAAWKAAGSPRSWDTVDWSRAAMLRAFLEGRDLYRETAAAGLNKPLKDITTRERQDMGKVPVLAMLYKISWKGLREYAWRSNQLDWTEAFSRHIWGTFNKLYPEFRRWHESEAEKILARGWTRTDLGRVRHLPDAFSPYDAIREAAVRSGINMPVQGLASDITQAAGILVDRALDPAQAFIIHEIHDALLLAVRRDCIETVAPLVKHYMEQAHLALRSLGLYLPEGLLIAEEKIGPWGKGVSLEKYLTSAAPVLA